MTSNVTNINTGNSPERQEGMDTDIKFSKIECPFTWMPGWVKRKIKPGHEQIFLDRENLQFQRMVDKQEYFPEFILIYHLMKAFEKVMKNEQPSTILECLNAAEQSLADIKQKAKLKSVENVLQHILIGTKCHALKKLGQLTEANELLKEICAVADMSRTELAMLNGCKCRALLLYHSNDLERITCAKKAIEYEPENSQWHFLLGKVCRSYRRKKFAMSYWPDERETLAFETAYDLSPDNELCGVALATLYRESGDSSKANEIYRKVHALQPTSCSVQLQLALGFIRAKEGKLAKDCLNYIAKKMPDSIRYEHYMGIYEEKCNGKPEAALPHYERATEKLNAAAEWQYVACKKKVYQNWDPLPYLLSLFKKYDGSVDHTEQDLNIHIGSYYLFEIPDILSACQYLTRAIEIEPKSHGLRHHYRLFHKSERVNIYDELTKTVQSALEIGAGRFDEDQITVLKNTLELCCKNRTNSPPPFPSSWAQPSSSQSSSSNRNYDRGSSSCVQINWREERSGTSTRGFSRDYPPSRSNDRLNSPKRHSASSNERDYTSWRSDKRGTQDSRNKHHLLNTFNNKRDSASTNYMRGRDVLRTSSSQPRNKNDVNEAGASCYLVKTMRDLNL